MHTNANRTLSSNPIPALEKEPILRISVLLWLCSFVFSAVSMAADIRYVGGQQSVPLSSGAGEDYPIVYRGLPPGTRLTVARTSEDGLWADIATDSGITGWIPTRNLVLELAPQPGLPAIAKPVQGRGRRQYRISIYHGYVGSGSSGVAKSYQYLRCRVQHGRPGTTSIEASRRQGGTAGH